MLYLCVKISIESNYVAGKTTISNADRKRRIVFYLL